MAPDPVPGSARRPRYRVRAAERLGSRPAARTSPGPQRPARARPATPIPGAASTRAAAGRREHAVDVGGEGAVMGRLHADDHQPTAATSQNEQQRCLKAGAGDQPVAVAANSEQVASMPTSSRSGSGRASSRCSLQNQRGRSRGPGWQAGWCGPGRAGGSPDGDRAPQGPRRASRGPERSGLAQQPQPDHSCSQHQHRDPSHHPAAHLLVLLLVLLALGTSSTVWQRPAATAWPRSHHSVPVTAGSVHVKLSARWLTTSR
jgi:hypothetical protein